MKRLRLALAPSSAQAFAGHTRSVGATRGPLRGLAKLRAPRAPPKGDRNVEEKRVVAAAGAAGGTEEERWRLRVDELEAHRLEFGHTAAVLGSALGKWVYLQRRLYKENKLSIEQVAELEGMGFEWEHPFDKIMASKEGWSMMVEELIAFKEETGHADVKKKEPTNPALGYWVNQQRIAYRENSLSPDQIAELDALGMVWLPKKQCGSKFMVGFRDLVAYRDQHGTLEVSPDSEEKKAIVTWCLAQRAAYGKGKLSEKRVAYLQGIGFFEVW